MIAYTNPSSLNVTFPRLHVAHVELGDTCGKKSLLMLLLEELRALFHRFFHDAQVHVIVLSQAGIFTPRSILTMFNDHICDGIEKTADQKSELRSTATLQTLVAIKQDCLSVVARCPKRMSIYFRKCEAHVIFGRMLIKLAI